MEGLRFGFVPIRMGSHRTKSPSTEALSPSGALAASCFSAKAIDGLSARILATQPELRWDSPRVAFETDFIDTPGRSYDVSPDGQRLIVVKRAAADIQTKLHVITNWFSPAVPVTR